MPTEPEKHVDLGAVRITSTRIQEMESSRVMVAVNRQEVIRARVAWARHSERPVLQLLLAVASGAFGMFTLINTLFWLRVGGSREAVAIMCVLLLPLGAWLGYDALRRGPVLLVETTRGRRRLVFGRQIRMDQLLTFVEGVNRELGYPLEVDDSIKRLP